MILVDGRQHSVISALDRGLAYGDGVFRTMRAEAGRVAFWPRHYSKLRADCGRLGIDCPAEATLGQEVDLILAGTPDCVIKVIVTRGQGGRGYALPIRAQPSRVVADFPLPQPRAGCDESGVHARWCDTRLAIQPLLAGIKHLNRLENVLARREWFDADIAEGLMLDQADQVIEGTATNLFILEAGRLVTPKLDGCGVAGVQRDRLLALAPRLNVGCGVEALTSQRVMAADQVYLVNSVIGLWWISDLDGRTWQRNGLTGELLRHLGQSHER